MTTNEFIKQQKSRLVHFKGNADYLVILGIVYIPCNTTENSLYFKVLLTNGMHAYLDCNFNLNLSIDMHLYDLKPVYSSNFKNGEYIKELVNKGNSLLQTNLEFLFTESYLYTEIFQQFLQDKLKVDYFPKLNLQIPICIKTSRINALSGLTQNFWKVTKNIRKGGYNSMQDIETAYFLHLIANIKEYISNEVQHIVLQKTDNIDYVPNVYSTIIETLREISTVKKSDEVINQVLNDRLSSFIPKVAKKSKNHDNFMSSLITEARLKDSLTTGYEYYSSSLDDAIKSEFIKAGNMVTNTNLLPDMDEPLDDVQHMNEPLDDMTFPGFLETTVEGTHIIQENPNNNFFFPNP